MSTTTQASQGYSTPPRARLGDERPPFPGTEVLNAAQVFSGPGYNAPAPQTDTVAAAALVCTLLSFLPGLGLLAVVLGLWALRRLRRSYDTGLAQAWGGVVVGTATSIAWVWSWLLISAAS